MTGVCKFELLHTPYYTYSRNGENILCLYRHAPSCMHPALIVLAREEVISLKLDTCKRLLVRIPISLILSSSKIRYSPEQKIILRFASFVIQNLDD